MNNYTLIAETASVYEDLNNDLATDPCTTEWSQAYRQETYRDAYDKLKAINIENLAIRLIADSVSDKVLIRLRSLIDENIHIYETRKEDFNNIGFNKIYALWEEYLFADQRALLLNEKEMIKEYPYPSEQEREMLLEENRSELTQFNNERDELRRTTASWIGKNYYLLIYELSRSFASILNTYFPVKKENQEPEIKSVIKEGVYFDMGLIAPIHKVCNNIQFENLSEIDFYALLNLQPTNARLIVKAGERTRVCYLIYKLYEYLKTDSRIEWRNIMLRTLDIKEDFYKSKYKEPVSELTGNKSEIFAQEINEILN